MSFHASGSGELAILQKTLWRAKFSGDPELEFLKRSPVAASLQRRIFSALAEAEIEESRNAERIRSTWTQGALLSNNPQHRSRCLEDLVSDVRWTNLGRVEQRSWADNLVAPLTATEEELDELLDEALRLIPAGERP